MEEMIRFFGHQHAAARIAAQGMMHPPPTATAKR